MDKDCGHGSCGDADESNTWQLFMWPPMTVYVSMLIVVNLSGNQMERRQPNGSSSCKKVVCRQPNDTHNVT
jgi:hypothetical protein